MFLIILSSVLDVNSSNSDAILYSPQLSSSSLLTIEINLFNDSFDSGLLILISNEPFKNYNNE